MSRTPPTKRNAMPIDGFAICNSPMEYAQWQQCKFCCDGPQAQYHLDAEDCHDLMLGCNMCTLEDAEGAQHVLPMRTLIGFDVRQFAFLFALPCVKSEDKKVGVDDRAIHADLNSFIVDMILWEWLKMVHAHKSTLTIRFKQYWLTKNAVHAMEILKEFENDYKMELDDESHMGYPNRDLWHTVENEMW